MARPAKAVSTATGKIDKEAKALRDLNEKLMSGNRDKLRPPAYLTDSQKDIFNFIVEVTDDTRILGNIDIFTLANGAVVIDKLIRLDKQFNEDPTLLMNNVFSQLQDRTYKQFNKVCNELSMSPQARAKISLAITEKPEKKKSLMELIDDEE